MDRITFLIIHRRDERSNDTFCSILRQEWTQDVCIIHFPLHHLLTVPFFGLGPKGSRKEEQAQINSTHGRGSSIDSPEFAIDENSREFALLNPSSVGQANRRRKCDSNDSSEEGSPLSLYALKEQGIDNDLSLFTSYQV
jgi:NUC153 domain